MRYIVLLLIVAISLTCCKPGNINNRITTSFFHKTKSLQLALQPFSDMPPAHVKYVYEHVKAMYSHCILLPPVALPASSWYAPRNRYRADSIMNWLSTHAADGQVIAGITSKDISTTKGYVKDYGVMGLGFVPGNACVVSAFRLKNGSDDQLYKVVLHELGHTQGLPHCTVKNCIMRDAEGHNTTDEETGFCPKCMKCWWIRVGCFELWSTIIRPYCRHDKIGSL